MIVSDEPDPRLMRVSNCAQIAAPSPASLSENACPLNVRVWLVPGVPTVWLVKFATDPSTSELAPTSDAIVPDGVPLALVATCVAPFCVADCPVTTATPKPQSLAVVPTCAVTVMLAETVTTPSQTEAEHPLPASVVLAVPFQVTVPPVLVGAVCRVVLNELANITTSSAPTGGVKLAVVSDVALALVVDLYAGVLASIASAIDAALYPRLATRQPRGSRAPRRRC